MPFNFFAPANWLASKFNPPPATSLFQTRITHTPGGFGQVGEGTSGGYVPNVNPGQIVSMQPGLTDQEKAVLANQPGWNTPGFIKLPPGDIQPDVIRHEQFHDLMAKSGALQHSAEIAPAVGQDVQELVRSLPVYQEEATRYGWPEVIADEGTAIDLINAQNRMGGVTPGLQAKVMQFIKNRTQQKQLQKLTAPVSR